MLSNISARSSLYAFLLLLCALLYVSCIPFNKRQTETTATVITSAPRTKLVVSAGNATTIQLPVDQVVLSSFVLPESASYKYYWELVSPLNRQEFGNIEGVNEKLVKLTHLKAGKYEFKVTVNGDNVESGSAIVSLTVLPMKTINKLPVAIVEPANSTVKLPLAETILDGSTSYDDDKIVRYQWQALEVPIGYRFVDSTLSILKLQDLIPGKYVFNMTITDSRDASNSTIAQINVLKEVDYPPQAIVDPAVVVNLPQNEVIIVGNKSSDDKAIVAWHWTRTDNGPMAIDMDGTSTPNLHLSKLEVGTYRFTLQVTDAAQQSSKAEVHLMVKEENNVAPNSNAGDNIDVPLPLQGPIKLDGSKSSDDIGIIKWNWTQISGPKTLQLRNQNTSVALIDSAVPGTYNFSLTVLDMKNLSSVSYKRLTVIQDHNEPPKALAGDDQTVVLPQAEVILNGSRSFDDAEIIFYRWERMSLSSAFGEFVGDSDRTPILRLTNLIPGRYLFRLTVTDAHGASSSDVASLIVKSPSYEKDQIEAHLNIDSASFTFEHERNFYKKLEALLSETEQVQIKPNSVERSFEKRTILIFTVESSHKSSQQIVHRIRSILRHDPKFFSLQVLSVDTVICQNTCSNHGTCDPFTKRCMCEAFWMENFIRLYYEDNESNCDWSILYVIIICFLILVFIIGLVWMLICLISNRQFRRWNRKSRSGRNYRRTNRFRYMLIDESENVEMTANLKNSSNASNRDSSEESDILADYQDQQKQQQQRPHKKRNKISYSKL